MARPQKARTSHPKRLVFIVLALLIVGGLAVFMVHKHQHPAQKVAISTAKSQINYSPPTKQEQQAGNQQKTIDQQQQQAIASNPTASSTANIVVVDASYYPYDGNVVEVRAYVSNIFENGGTCTATFTQNGQTVTASSTASEDATTTQCAPIDIARSQFPTAGDWQLVVSYSSASATGQTTPQTVSINP